MRIFLLHSLLILFPLKQAFAQNTKTDSLLNVISKSKSDTSKVINLLALANLYSTNKKHDLSKPKLYEALRVSKKLNWTKGEALAAVEISNLHYDSHAKDSASIYRQNAILLFEKIKDYKSASYQNLIAGINFYENHNFPESKKHLVRSLELARQIKNKPYEINSLEYLGWLYHYMGNYKLSNQYNQQAIDLAKKEKLNDRAFGINVNIANNHIAQGNYQEAQNIYLAAAEFYKKQNKFSEYANYLATGGNLYRRLNASEKAEKPLLEAYHIQDTINDTWNQLTSSRFLGMLYTEQKRLIPAEKYLKKSLELAKEFKSDSDIIKSYYTLERLYYVKNDFAEGDRYQKLILQMRDSLYTQESNELLAGFDAKYKNAEKEAQLREAKLEIAQKKNWIIGMAMGLIIISVAGTLFWRIRNIKNKAAETERLKNFEIENQKKLISAREIERQRIAKELHDSVGSQLTVVSTSLDNAFYLFENKQLVSAKLENISGEVRLAAQSLRDTIWATYNSEITASDLKSRIQEFIKKFEVGNSFKTEIHFKGDDLVLNPIEGLNLFRIVQEAFNNVQKYAKATLVIISGNFQKENLTLEIIDNGIGFSSAESNSQNSFGLNNMKSRALEIGGVLEINSSPEGTSIKFTKSLYSIHFKL